VEWLLRSLEGRAIPVCKPTHGAGHISCGGLLMLWSRPDGSARRSARWLTWAASQRSGAAAARYLQAEERGCCASRVAASGAAGHGAYSCCSCSACGRPPWDCVGFLPPLLAAAAPLADAWDSSPPSSSRRKSPSLFARVW